MDDNGDRKAKENDKIYKIIFEKKNTWLQKKISLKYFIALFYFEYQIL